MQTQDLREKKKILSLFTAQKNPQLVSHYRGRGIPQINSACTELNALEIESLLYFKHNYQIVGQEFSFILPLSNKHVGLNPFIFKSPFVTS